MKINERSLQTYPAYPPPLDRHQQQHWHMLLLSADPMHQTPQAHSKLDHLYQLTLTHNAYKDIELSDDGRSALLEGVNILANAVQVTLGLTGCNVIIEQAYGEPKITKHGVTVAQIVTLKDKSEKLGARLIQDVA